MRINANDGRHDASNVITSLSRTCLTAALKDLDDSNMNDLLFRPIHERPRSVLVDACAIWCGPCKLIEPYLLKCGESLIDYIHI